MRWGQGLLTAIHANGAGVCVDLHGRARLDAVVVRPPALLFLLLTLAPEDPNEGLLELTAVTGVNNGVQAAVEVAQPEDHFEECFRSS